MIFGKPLSTYIRFVGPVALVVFLIGMTRLVLSLNGVPDTTTGWVSASAAGMIAVIVLTIRVQTSGFGSYKQLLPTILLANSAAHFASIVGIMIAIYTGQSNVFTIPHYSLGRDDGKTWGHVGAHLGLGMVVSGLFFYLVCCLILLITRALTKGRGRSAHA